MQIAGIIERLSQIADDLIAGGDELPDWDALYALVRGN